MVRRVRLARRRSALGAARCDGRELAGGGDGGIDHLARADLETVDDVLHGGLGGLDDLALVLAHLLVLALHLLDREHRASA